ncbi:hypothetical protein FKM82_021287 [Ascaphus truei]
MHNAKRSGERGQPCLIPLLIKKGSEANLWWVTLADGSEYRANIAFVNFSPRPNAPSLASKYGQSFLSKAFSASRLSAKTGINLKLAISNRSIIRLMLSVACRPVINPT